MEYIQNERVAKNIDELVDMVKGDGGDLDHLVLNIKKLIDAKIHSLAEPYKPKNILESRFTPTEEAYDRGFKSCGAISNIASDVLKRLGYKVKLVYGESEDSVDHAWISVNNPETNTWKEYDLTMDNLEIPDTHKKRGEVDSWENIREQIKKDHQTWDERRIERGS